MISFEHTIWIEIVFGIFVFFVPFLLIVVFHMMKIFKLKKKEYFSPQQLSPLSRRLSLVSFAVILIYILSTFPMLAYQILFLICYRIDFNVTECQSLYDYTVSIVSLCLLLNNAINPLIYFFFIPQNLKFCKRIKHCCEKS
jgi:amino acid transporter